MICYQCGHQIKRDFAKFCDHCGSNLEIKPKTSFTKKEIAINMDDEIDRATNLFLLWNGNIVATFIFYIIHIVTDSYAYLFLLVLFMCLLSWMLILIKLHDLAARHNEQTKQFILINFGIPIIGTFYSFIKLTQRSF
jgi:hypothetical protein